MREIKFRGKRLDNGEWAYGAFVPDALEQTYGKMMTWDFICRYNPNQIVESVEMIEVDRNTVGQFTGFKDKNGKEIFEGDIVKFLDIGEEGYEYREGYDFNNIASIIWKNGRFELDNIYDDNSAVLEFMNNESHEEFIYALMNDCEIIGNIYDNPELSKVRE